MERADKLGGVAEVEEVSDTSDENSEAEADYEDDTARTLINLGRPRDGKEEPGAVVLQVCCVSRSLMSQMVPRSSSCGA